MELYSRFFKRDPGSFFLFGPRGTGKSTLVTTLFPDAYVIDLLSPEEFQKMTSRPETLSELIEGNPRQKNEERKFLIPWLRSCPAPKVWIAECAAAEDVYAMVILLIEEGLYDKRVSLYD